MLATRVISNLVVVMDEVVVGVVVDGTNGIVEDVVAVKVVVTTAKMTKRMIRTKCTSQEM
jgi:hypothetical protein